eukprot:706560-Pelagomonas_calceolata.AAC.1
MALCVLAAYTRPVLLNRHFIQQPSHVHLGQRQNWAWGAVQPGQRAFKSKALQSRVPKLKAALGLRDSAARSKSIRVKGRTGPEGQCSQAKEHSSLRQQQAGGEAMCTEVKDRIGPEEQCSQAKKHLKV